MKSFTNEEYEREKFLAGNTKFKEVTQFQEEAQFKEESRGKKNEYKIEHEN